MAKRQVHVNMLYKVINPNVKHKWLQILFCCVAIEQGITLLQGLKNGLLKSIGAHHPPPVVHHASLSNVERFRATTFFSVCLFSVTGTIDAQSVGAQPPSVLNAFTFSCSST